MTTIELRTSLTSVHAEVVHLASRLRQAYLQLDLRKQSSTVHIDMFNVHIYAFGAQPCPQQLQLLSAYA